MVSKEIQKQAVDLKAQFQLGKDGVTPSFISSIDKYLTAHELVKIKVLIAENKESLEYFANAVAEELNAEVCFKRGSMFALYRKNEKN